MMGELLRLPTIKRVLRDRSVGISEAATIVCRVFDVLAELAELRPYKAIKAIDGHVSTASLRGRGRYG